MDHTCHSRVFSSVTTLLRVSESIAEVPHRQVAKRANQPSHSSILFFSEGSTIMAKEIAMIQTRRSTTGSGLLHRHHSVLKPFSRDSQVLEGKYLSLYALLFRSVLCIKQWLRLHRKRNLEHELFCLDVYNT